MKYRLPSVKRLKNLKRKTALVRVDYNVESARDALRLKRSLTTIKFLLARGANVVLISHRGRPKTGLTKEKKPKYVTSDTSLRFVLPFLRKHLKSVTVSFLSDFDIPKAAGKVAEAGKRTVFVLENLRLHPGEKGKDIDFARELASLGDIFVQDAFAVAHRGDASMTLISTFLPSYAGLVLLDEVTHLSSVMHDAKKPLVVVLGGGKATDKFSVVKNLHRTAQQFLVGGVLGNTFLKAKKMQVENSIVEKGILKEVSARVSDRKIITPVDWVYDDEHRILDIGAATGKRYAKILEGAKTIIWNGPMGVFEKRQFRNGTLAVARAISRSKGFSVVGGGETTQFILEQGLEKRFGFLSTGGGAMLSFLAGKPMPGLDALLK